MVFVIKVKYGDILRRFTFESKPRGEDLSYPILESRIRRLFDLPTEKQIRVTYTDRDDDLITMADDQDLVDALILQSLNPLRLHVSAIETNSVALDVIPAVPTSESGVAKESSEVPFNQILKGQIAGSMKQAYEPFFSGAVPSPRHLNLMVEHIVRTVTAQVSDIVKLSEMKSRSVGEVLSGVSEATKIGNAAPTAGFPLPRPTEASTSLVKSESNEAVELKTVNRVFHHGVQCDACGMCPIVGTRFKSSKKHDYDLCSTCIKEAEDQADYTRIDRPLFRPRHLHSAGPLHPAGSGRMRCPALESNHYPGRHVSMSGPYSSRPTGRCYQGPAHQMNGSMYAGKLDSRFVEDVTIMDGTEMTPGTRFTKIWRLRNSGKSPWASLTKLVHVGGDELGSVFVVPLELPEQGLLPEQEVEAAVDLVAPEKPGRYVSHWRLASPAGPKFGHRVWVVIQVVLKDSFTPVSHEAVDMSADKSQEDEVTEKAPLPAAVAYESREDFVKASHEALEQPQQPQQKIACPEVDMTSSFVDILEPFSGLKISEMERHVEVAKENYSVTESTEEVSSENVVQVQEEVAALENSELGGGFSMVEMPSNVSNEASSIPITPRKEVEVTASSKEGEKVEVGDESVEEEQSTPERLSEKLEAMGFSDRILNVDLLVRNKCDLRRTLDDFFAAAEWDPILEELEEMGFYDVQMNRRLMFKNRGSVKHVVKELVQLYKEPEFKGTERVRSIA